MSLIGVVTFDKPCYLTTTLGLGVDVYVNLIQPGGPDKSVLLSTTNFAEVNGVCGAIEVVTSTFPPLREFYIPTQRRTVQSDGWGIVQRAESGLTINLSDDGQPITIPLVLAPKAAESVEPDLGPGPVKTKLRINGGSIYNGIENSNVIIYYPVPSGQDVIRCVIPYPQGSTILTDTTITGFQIQNPASSPPENYFLAGDVTLEDEMSAVVMEKPVIPAAKTDGLIGVDYYLASMVESGPIPMTNLTG
jgi:hypothetical protein